MLDETLNEFVQGRNVCGGFARILRRLWRRGVVGAVCGMSLCVTFWDRDYRRGSGYQVVDHFGTHWLIQEDV